MINVNQLEMIGMSAVVGMISLPAETVVLFFEQIDSPLTLGKAEQVCKQWKQILDAHSTIWQWHLNRVTPNGLATTNPKLVNRLKPEAHYRSYAELNITLAITSNMVFKGLIEMIPYGCRSSHPCFARPALSNYGKC